MTGARAALFVRREFAAALHARWFIVYAALFLIAGVLLAAFGMGNTMIYGYRGFAKAFAGLVHLALFLVPLMALFPSAASIADERESGVLEYLLAQPVSFGEVYAGKWGGINVAMLLALTIGFGAAGAVAVMRGVPLAFVLAAYGFVLLLATAFVAVGLLLSSVAVSRARALTFGVVLWFLLIALGTLGVMVASIRWGIPERVLLVWSFVNPIEAFRIGVMSVLDPDLSLLGPIGIRLVGRLGSTGTAALAALSLAMWSVIPGLIGLRLFRSRV